MRLIDPAASLQSWLREGVLILADWASLQNWLRGHATDTIARIPSYFDWLPNSVGLGLELAS